MFELRINTGNAAFDDDGASKELANLLRYVANYLENMPLPADGAIRERQLFDSNGNRCGAWTFTKDSDA